MQDSIRWAKKAANRNSFVAKRVADLCTGRHTLAQIIDIVSSERSLEKTFLADDVTALADLWRNLGLIEQEGDRLTLNEQRYRQLRISHTDEAPGLTRLLWDLTRRCNLKCHHCYAHREDDQCQDLTLEQISTVLRQLEAVPPYVVVFGGGEPFVRSDLLDILRETKKKLDCRIKVLTNGTLLTKDVVHGVRGLADFMQFSLDGTREHHEVLRGIPGCYEKTIAGIDLAANEGIRIGLCMTLNRKNVGDIEAMIDFAVARGAYKIRISPLVLAGKALQSIDEWAIPASQMRWLYDRLFEYRLAFKDRILLDFRDELYGNAFLTGCMADDHSQSNEYFLCAAGRSLFYINAEGNITPCNFIDTPQYHLGNVRTTNVADIWTRDPLLRRLRQLRVDDIGGCETCGRKRRCGGGLRCNAVMMYDSFVAPDPFCHFRESSA